MKTPCGIFRTIKSKLTKEPPIYIGELRYHLMHREYEIARKERMLEYIQKLMNKEDDKEKLSWLQMRYKNMTLMLAAEQKLKKSYEEKVQKWEKKNEKKASDSAKTTCCFW